MTRNLEWAGHVAHVGKKEHHNNANTNFNKTCLKMRIVRIYAYIKH
jgi:hypothetical protein